jgi:hypothetical protein
MAKAMFDRGILHLALHYTFVFEKVQGSSHRFSCFLIELMRNAAVFYFVI